MELETDLPNYFDFGPFQSNIKMQKVHTTIQWRKLHMHISRYSTLKKNPTASFTMDFAFFFRKQNFLGATSCFNES